MDFKAAKCPSCAGDLQLPDNLDSAKCMYCGNTIVVREAIQLAAGSVNVDNLLKLAEAAFESGNNKEAYDYYTKVLEYDQNSYKAWCGKGLSAAWQSNLFNLRIDEAVNCIKQGFSKTPKDELDNIKMKVALNFVKIASALYYTMLDYKGDKWELYNNKTNLMPIKLCEYAYSCMKSNSILDNVWLKNILEYYILTHLHHNNDESEKKIKSIISIIHKHEADFSFAKYAQEIITNSWLGSIGTLGNADFINFVNKIDDKHKLSPPPPPAPANSGGCFIATAAWGTPLADQVISLQLFRDTHLLKNEYGRRFVNLYYRLGPPIADIISGNELLKTIVRTVLRPLVFAIKFMK